MAWIHPEINGDYKIIGVTTSKRNATSSNISDYNNFVINDVNGISDLAAVTDILLWKAGVSTSSISAKDNLGPFSQTIYNTQGQEVAPGSDRLFNDYSSGPSTPLTNAIKYRLDGVEYIGPPSYSIEVWSGTLSGGGIVPFRYLGSSDPDTGGVIFDDGSQWETQNTFPSTVILPMYGISPLISTISGSLSGTINRTQTDIWAIGAITLIDNTDFGGDVTILEAIDSSQVPPTPDFGLFKLNVGVGGTAPGSWPEPVERVPTKNTGTDNIIEGEIGYAIASGGVVYE